MTSTDCSRTSDFPEKAKPQPSSWIGFTVIHSPPKPGFPAPHPSDKKFNWRLVTPTES